MFVCLNQVPRLFFLHLDTSPSNPWRLWTRYLGSEIKQPHLFVSRTAPVCYMRAVTTKGCIWNMMSRLASCGPYWVGNPQSFKLSTSFNPPQQWPRIVSSISLFSTFGLPLVAFHWSPSFAFLCPWAFPWSRASLRSALRPEPPLRRRRPTSRGASPRRSGRARGWRRRPGRRARCGQRSSGRRSTATSMGCGDLAVGQHHWYPILVGRRTNLFSLF